tara:strand:+ start:4075 stop:4581 length:507 start_codon:yes stop_codon:yes gene_type:complete
MKDFLKKVAEQSRFEIDIFDGALKVQGRILSPQESEALGITSGMLAAQLFPGRVKQKMPDFSALNDIENMNEENWAKLLEIMEEIQPETLLQFSEHQDRIISKCIKMGSTDDGKTWSKLHLVLTEEEQAPDLDRLWIGLLKPEDRKAIVDRAMSGHEEAAKRLASFRS